MQYFKQRVQKNTAPYCLRVLKTLEWSNAVKILNGPINKMQVRSKFEVDRSTYERGHVSQDC